MAPALERMAPHAIDRLRRRNENFRSVLQLNLAALSAAREVSENLIRSVADAVDTASRPVGYGRAGDMDAASGSNAIALDQSVPRPRPWVCPPTKWPATKRERARRRWIWSRQACTALALPPARAGEPATVPLSPTAHVSPVTGAAASGDPDLRGDAAAAPRRGH
jgi:hypothetical protein